MRQRAEARLKAAPGPDRPWSAVAPTEDEEPFRLIHELQVHEVELEMQNAELQEARDRAEALLEKFSDLYDFAPVGFFTLDGQGRILEVNLTGAAALGVERSRLIGRRLGSFVDAEARAGFGAFLERTRAQDEPQTCETRMARADGTPFWAGLHSAPVLPGIGPAKSRRLALTDITSRRQAEEVVRLNEALFTTLIEQAPFGVYLVDDRFRLQQVNPRALPIFRNVQPLLGRDFAEIHRALWPRKASDPVVARFRHTLKTGEPYVAPEFTAKRRDTGATESYEWQIQRITLPSGRHGVVAFFMDITARKQAEATRRDLAVMTASNRSLEEEIGRRQTVEKALRKSELGQRNALEESRLLQDQLRLLSRQALSAQEEERRRISRELHDVIAQTLTGIGLRLANLKTETERDPRTFFRALARTQRLVLRSVGIVHEFARELRPAVLDDLGLVPALHSFMKGFAARTGLRTGLNACAAVAELDTVRRTVLFRVAQEALNNVARHAHASRVDVAIEKTPVGLRMSVRDDGKSFSAGDVLRAADGKHLGLLGMRERLEMIGGTLGIESNRADGTVITALVPVPRLRGKGATHKAKKSAPPPREDRDFAPASALSQKASSDPVAQPL